MKKDFVVHPGLVTSRVDGGYEEIVRKLAEEAALYPKYEEFLRSLDVK